MKISTAALLAAPVALVVGMFPASVSCPEQPTSDEPILQVSKSEPIPLRVGGVRAGEEERWARTPPRRKWQNNWHSESRDLMFRAADRADFHAVQPFMLSPGAPRSIEEQARDGVRSDYLLASRRQRALERR